MTRRKRTTTPTVLAHKKANVSLHRNGLSIEVGEVAAEDAGLAAKELLDVMRTLVRMGYDELLVDAGSLHGGALGEMPEEDGIGTETDPIVAITPKRIGF
jgi:hypothetical protein